MYARVYMETQDTCAYTRYAYNFFAGVYFKIKVVDDVKLDTETIPTWNRRFSRCDEIEPSDELQNTFRTSAPKMDFKKTD